jgi:uncharacterized membrane protein YcaP (DUF421 family)
MKKEEIHLADFKRILFGQAPPEFLVEVLIRTIIVYVALLILLRLMGKRMDGQISIIEMAVMITLGAIVAVGVQLPERGILPACVALICVYIFQRGMNTLSVKKEKFEHLTQGSLSILVKDGVLQLDEMKRAGVTRQNLFATLRSRKILNLGKVKRVYFEACGLFNVYEDKDLKPGLPVLPPGEEKFIEAIMEMDGKHIACKNCGFIDEAKQLHIRCKNCGELQWMEAVLK